MSTSRQITAETLAVAEMAVALVENCIREQMERCPHVEHGPSAYHMAENAIRAAFEEVRRTFSQIRKEGGGS